MYSNPNKASNQYLCFGVAFVIISLIFLGIGIDYSVTESKACFPDVSTCESNCPTLVGSAEAWACLESGSNLCCFAGNECEANSNECFCDSSSNLCLSVSGYACCFSGICDNYSANGCSGGGIMYGIGIPILLIAIYCIYTAKTKTQASGIINTNQFIAQNQPR